MSLQVSIAGPYRSGKTTLAVLLKNLLRSQGFRDVKIQGVSKQETDVMAEMPEGPKEKIQSTPIKIIEISTPLEVALVGPPAKEQPLELTAVIDPPKMDRPPKFYVDKNHRGVVMGVASMDRKHDLEFICTVEQNEEGARNAEVICALLNEDNE
jgi:hypothetical protein